MKYWLKRFFRFCIVMLAAGCTLIAALIRWAFRTWPNLKLEELRYEIAAPLTGTGGGLIQSAVLQCAVPALLVLIALAVLVRILSKKHPDALSRVLFVCCTSAVFLAVSSLIIGAEKLDLAGYISRMGKNYTYIEDRYVYPDNAGLQFPEKKRNLIYIFLESMEVTYTDKASGGEFDENRIPELTALAREYEDFSGDSSAINGFYSPYCTSWTVAAMFGHTSGLPFITDMGFNNFMNVQEAFFPSVVTLGDILQREGYNQTLMVGSDADFGGRQLYFTSHGDYTIHDYEYAVSEGLLDPGYFVWWGYEDQRLFENAKNELTRLSSLDAPFNLTLLTVDTHFEDGYVCPLCPDTFEDQYSNVMACSSRQTAEFIEWIQQQDFYEDTAVVLVGDHLTMDADYFSDLSIDEEDRKVYTSFINAAVTPALNTAREFTTFDLFPTTLSAMGVTIQGDRLGLGTDLFSATPTHLETDGWETMDFELRHRSLFMEYLASVQKNYAQGRLNFLRGENEHELLVEVRDINYMRNALKRDVADAKQIERELDSVRLELTGSSGSTKEILLEQHPDRSFTAKIDLSEFENGFASYRVYAHSVSDEDYLLTSGSGNLLLCERTELDGYLDELLRLENHSIFMTAAGDVSALLTDEVIAKLQALGTNIDLSQLSSQSLYMIFSPDGVTELSGSSELSLRGELFDQTNYTIVSNGASSDQEGCHIYVGGKDHAPNQTGLNIVVYDHAAGRVVDVSVFDNTACAKSAELSVEIESGMARVEMSSIHHAMDVLEYQLWCWDDQSIGMPQTFTLTEKEPGVYSSAVDLTGLNQSSLHMTAYAVCAPVYRYGTALGYDMNRMLPLAVWQNMP